MTGLGPEVLDLARMRWTWAKGTGLGPNALDLQVQPSPAKSSLDLTGNDWTWQENLVHVPPWVAPPAAGMRRWVPGATTTARGRRSTPTRPKSGWPRVQSPCRRARGSRARSSLLAGPP